MSFRKEKKYRFSKSEMTMIKNNLLQNGMAQLHPSRIVNSCYFDTNTFSLFHDSEEGTLPRKKIRVRWYNDELKLSKEIKISSIEGRFKTTENIGKFTSENNILELRYFDKNYGYLIPSILVRYERFYYNLDKMRLTFDQNISYQRLTSKILPILKDKECVLEVKVPINTDDDYIERYVSVPNSRFSKYSRGVLNFEKNIKNI